MRMQHAYVLRRGYPIRRHVEDYATNLISGCCGVPNKPTKRHYALPLPNALTNASMRPLIDPFAETEILTYYSLSCCLFRVLIIYGPFFVSTGLFYYKWSFFCSFRFDGFITLDPLFWVQNEGLLYMGIPLFQL